MTAPYTAGDVIDTEYGPVTVVSIEQTGTRPARPEYGMDEQPVYDFVLRAPDGAESNCHGVFHGDAGERPRVAWSVARSAWLRMRGGHHVGDVIQGREVVERTAEGSLICGTDGDYVVFNPSGWRVGTYKTRAGADRSAARADALQQEDAVR